jgi:hypothetical protein
MALASVMLGCPHTSDDDYIAHVNHLLARGPADACCSMSGGDPDPARTQKCRNDAPLTCAVVVGAKVTKLTGIGRFGDDTGATVSVDIAGPNGHGHCHFQMYRDGTVGYGGCEPDE